MTKVYQNTEILEDGILRQGLPRENSTYCISQGRGLKLETDYKALVNEGSFIFFIFLLETIYLFIYLFVYLFILLKTFFGHKIQ